jgi:hypothetical protein
MFIKNIEKNGECTQKQNAVKKLGRVGRVFLFFLLFPSFTKAQEICPNRVRDTVITCMGGEEAMEYCLPTVPVFQPYRLFIDGMETTFTSPCNKIEERGGYSFNPNRYVDGVQHVLEFWGIDSVRTIESGFMFTTLAELAVYMNSIDSAGAWFVRGAYIIEAGNPNRLYSTGYGLEFFAFEPVVGTVSLSYGYYEPYYAGSSIMLAKGCHNIVLEDMRTGCIDTGRVCIAHADITPAFTQIAPICAGNSFTLPATSNNGIAGTWSPAANNMATTTYTFTPAANQCADTATMEVTVDSIPVPEISINGNMLAASAGYSSYRWALDGADIPDANGDTFTAQTNGVYTVTVTNANGCLGISGSIQFTTVGIQQNPLAASVKVYPNPFTDRLNITGNKDYQLYNLLNQEVYNTKGKSSLSDLSPGAYILKSELGAAIVIKKSGF